jgi:hypothetical protein
MAVFPVFLGGMKSVAIPFDTITVSELFFGRRPNPLIGVTTKFFK